MAEPFVIPTPGFNGYGVAFSPFEETRLAVASSQHFGIVGNGRLAILNLRRPPRPGVDTLAMYDSPDGMFDCCWSEGNENHIVCASGDGSVRLFDVKLPDYPVQIFQEHQREVHGVSWNLVAKDTFLSASWDRTVKLWSPEFPKAIATFADHMHCVYNAIWCPHRPDVFASASGDRTIKVWDTKMPRPHQTFVAHDGEVLTLDWNKYRENTVVSAGVDKTIRTWDLRSPLRPLLTLQGHERAIRRLKCSPHKANVVATASYDFTVGMWNLDAVEDPLMMLYTRHTEFVCGLDFNLYIPGQIATASWDETVHILQPPCLL